MSGQSRATRVQQPRIASVHPLPIVLKNMATAFRSELLGILYLDVGSLAEGYFGQLGLCLALRDERFWGGLRQDHRESDRHFHFVMTKTAQHLFSS